MTGENAAGALADALQQSGGGGEDDSECGVPAVLVQMLDRLEVKSG
nr:hypothetical protein [Escherichia coli]